MLKQFDIVGPDLSPDENCFIGFGRKSLPVSRHNERLSSGTIGICTAGTAEVEVNFVKYRLVAGMMFAAFPRQVVKQRLASDDFCIDYISCSDDMFKNATLFFPAEFDTFIEKAPVLKVSDAAYERVGVLLKLLMSRYDDTANVCRSEIVVSLLRVLYLELYNEIHLKISGDRIMPSRKMDIMERFFDLVRQNFRENRDVAFYADRLNVTPKYLSVISREVEGVGAKRFIDGVTVTEIKIELKSSTKTLLEISQELKFADPSFFCKYFRSHTGLTPKEYRNGRTAEESEKSRTAKQE